MKIITQYTEPPIPVTRFDWTAVYEGYEPGDPVGYGSTEEIAKKNLQEMNKVVL
jgi:hypothetical protein